jgi:Family of unknown function (DUF5709)
VSETDDFSNDELYGDSVYEDGVEDASDFDPIEDLTGESDPEEPYDTSYSPPDHRPAATRHGLTDYEQAAGESLDERLAEEVPDISADDYGDGDSEDGSPVEPRAGRLVAPDEGAHADAEGDSTATDVGPAGFGSSAEEAAVHVIDADSDYEGFLESDDVDD